MVVCLGSSKRSMNKGKETICSTVRKVIDPFAQQGGATQYNGRFSFGLALHQYQP